MNELAIQEYLQHQLLCRGARNSEHSGGVPSSTNEDSSHVDFGEQ